MKDDNVIWKDIKGFEGLYQISSTGNVKSLRNDKILSPYMCKNGYWYIVLSVHNIQTKKTIHRLVAEAFIPNPQNKLQVNHKNGIRADDRVENLEWVTPSENNLHSYHVLHRKGAFAGKYGKDNPGSKPILQIKDGKIIAEFYGCGEASRKTGANQSHINSCCRGIRQHCGGYEWKYK